MFLVGEEIPFEQYLDRYKEQILYILSELKCVDIHSEYVKPLLSKEWQKAEIDYYRHFEEYRRAPDKYFLNEKFMEFGSYRADIFFKFNDSVLSEDNFIYRYQEHLLLSSKLKKNLFSESDYQFVLKRESYKAKKYYQERNEFVQGYEQERISINRFMQSLGYKQLERTFDDDYQNFYQVLER